MLTARSRVIEPVYNAKERELDVVSRTLISLFEQLVKQSRKLPPEVLASLSGIDDPSRVADSIAAHLSVRMADKQKVLETTDVGQRLELLIGWSMARWICSRSRSASVAASNRRWRRASASITSTSR
jgi:ATP-dependent Lon protease